MKIIASFIVLIVLTRINLTVILRYRSATLQWKKNYTSAMKLHSFMTNSGTIISLQMRNQKEVYF